MDDIVGLNWSSTPANGQRPATSTSNYSAFTTLKPTPPASRRASPLNPPSSQPPSKSAPANDSFANLIPFGTTSNKDLSLLEQQKRQTVARPQQRRTPGLSNLYAGGDEQFWNDLGNGQEIPAIDSPKDRTTSSKNTGLDDDDDLFAIFNEPKNGKIAPAAQKIATVDDDDDPFGLSEAGPRQAGTATTTSTLDDDDVLGLLGKPVVVPNRKQLPPPATRNEPTNVHLQNKAVADLVDMGFPMEKAKVALEATESGLDVQAAVGFLLNQAHAEARQKVQSRNTSRPRTELEEGRMFAHVEAQTSSTEPHFEDRGGSRDRSRVTTPAGEKDFEKVAAEFGTNFLKTANSLWKQSTKRVQQAVQEFNSDG